MGSQEELLLGNVFDMAGAASGYLLNHAGSLAEEGGDVVIARI